MTETTIDAHHGATDTVENDARWARLADDLGLSPRPAPLRRWVQSPNAGHLSGLVWGSPKSEIVFVHDLGDSSNGWDALAIATGRDVVALDLPGHGRSSSASSIAPPARQAPALIDAIRSLAPSAALVVASGLGAAVAVQAAIKRPASIRALLVVDGGPVASVIGPLVDPEGFADQAAVERRLADVAPRRHRAFIRHLAAETTFVNEAGRLEWRYQLGRAPDDFDAYTSVARTAELTVPLAVVSSNPESPLDPIVRSIVGRWPQVQRFEVNGPADDLVGSSPLAVARAIEKFLIQLTGASAS